MLIALHILCDGKTTVPKGGGGVVGVSMVEGGVGGEEIFAMAEIHVRLIILKIRYRNDFLSKRKLKLIYSC